MSLDKESPGHDRNDHRGNMLFSPIKDTSLLSRRQFVNIAATTMGGMFTVDSHSGFLPKSSTLNALENTMTNESDISMIGQYGPWAASLSGRRLPSHSYRRKKWSDLEKWRTAARKRVLDRISMPEIGGLPKVTVKNQYEYDSLHVEELEWQLPYGRPTEAFLLKPVESKGKLPGIMAFHDHGGIKYFGKRKITITSDKRHPLIEEHQKEFYSGLGWANEIARRGYVVLVSDAFPFASRRVKMCDVPEFMRNGLTDDDPEKPENIEAYNEWAGEHESIMAKSLFCSNTTWPGVFCAEDLKALDILCARDDVNADRIGCGGLSGGGMRTVFAGGLDPRIKCAVCVGFMTTWRDFLLYKSYTHTWMTYVPVLPNELDFPEILGLRVPLPTMVLNDNDDDLYTLSEMKRADDILRWIFEKAGAGDKYKCSFYPGEHKFDKAMQCEAFDWFDRWLKS